MAADDPRVDALYEVAPEGFVAARDALAKALKAEGDKDAAAEVKALRRPTVAAWAVNQVARTTKTKKDVAALLQVGDALRDAHEALLDGKGDAGIREATADRRKLVARLTKAAVELLGPSGESQRDAITNTFDAAVADPEAGLVVRAGRLQKELDAPSGFGGELVFAATPAAPRTSGRRDERRAARRSRRDPEPAAPVRAEEDGEARTQTHGGSGTRVRTAEAEAAAGAPSAADRAAARAAAKEAERRRKQLARDAEDRQHEAQQAAREAAASRQEVSRLQDLLVSANAKAKAADDKAKLAQWQAATAQQALREAEAEIEVAAEPG